jgi:hypothetical protein
VIVGNPQGRVHEERVESTHVSIEEIEAKTLNDNTLEEQRCTSDYFVLVDEEPTLGENSPSSTPTTTPIEVIDESDVEVIPSTQWEDAQVISDHMGLTPPLNKSTIASHGS